MARIFIFLLVIHNTISAQVSEAFVWYDPMDHMERFEGQGWDNMGYHRFPDKAKNLVRDAVWQLSQNAAGLNIKFQTDSQQIVVKYIVSERLGMPHMPTTGVSGLDLYTKDGDKWLWCKGAYQFKDTIEYHFKIKRQPDTVREYQLFLPLYNTVKHLEIGVPKTKGFKFIPCSTKKPIVVYGTSIVQGACASRPGMAWTNIVSRNINSPIVNLGFSGNGRLEEEVIDLLMEIDAAVYVLDCMPNLKPSDTKEEVMKRIFRSVDQLRVNNNTVPIVLVQHSGYSDGLVNWERQHRYKTLNKWLTKSYKQLIKDGAKNVYLITKSDLCMTNDSYVDGTHPNDLGMNQYAKAYQKTFMKILPY
ncbi:hydrolase [Muricauda sp. TY007]|uniref:SGNH/GDSL hydrolase family protein n=1 Tax=Allomuricauda sp. TY007 TaxID=2683200 RepID=UPI0013C25915|nr:SGNH/GDSL hydrolase family protein [Muricauda sp. TY007]NDV16947.1 hydrolase [Muricauda sp. TY007]